MYSPALLPSRWRAAVAKKRIWSTIGGISSERVSADRLAGVLDLEGDELLAARLDGVGDAEQGERALGGRGVAPRPRTRPRRPASRRRRRRPTTAAPSAYCSPGHRVDDVRGLPVGRVDLLAVDEVRERLHGRVCITAPPLPGSRASLLRPTIGAFYAHALMTAIAAITSVGVPKEIKTAEHRVAMTPDGVRELERHGIQVRVEAGAGEGRVDQPTPTTSRPAPTSCPPPPTPGRSRWSSR